MKPFKSLQDLPKALHLIWHGVNDVKNLELFLKSNVYWAEGDLRSHEGRLVLRHDPFDSHPLRPGETLLEAGDAIRGVLEAGRGLQIDLKEGGETMERMIALLRETRFPEERLWFTTNLKDVTMVDYTLLGRAFPQVRLQSAVPLRYMHSDMSEEERSVWLEINRGLGVTHLSIPWTDEPQPAEVEEVRRAGFGVNFFYVDTIEDFRKALLLKPDAVTSDFHIPEWGLHGRGSGENGVYLEVLEKA